MRILTRLVLVVAVLGTLASCMPWRRSKPAAEAIPAGPGRLVVSWLGHGCFLVTSSIGISVLTDPFSPKAVGYSYPRALRADVVLTSNESELANYVEPVGGNPLLLRSRLAAGVTRANGILFRGVPFGSAEDAGDGSGVNVAFAWTLDGIRFAHLGSPKRVPFPEELAQLGGADIVFVPVGGALSREQIDPLLDRMGARIAVPMAYRTPKATRPGIGSIDPFLAGRTNVTRLAEPGFSLSPGGLPETPAIFVPALP